MTGAQALALLETRYPQFYDASMVIGDGTVLVASMNLDEEAHFEGVKVNVQSDRQFPRTYKYGWPNVIASPSPLLVSRAYAGAWYLDYEGVVPQQVLDWVALECYRLLTLDQTRVVTQETVQGASVKYAPPSDYPKGQQAQLDRIQESLIAPFLKRDGHTVPFINWNEWG